MISLFGEYVLNVIGHLVDRQVSGVQYEVYIQYQPDVKAKLDIVHFQCNWFSGQSIPNIMSSFQAVGSSTSSKTISFKWTVVNMEA